MSVETALESAFTDVDWVAAGLDNPEHWPRGLHAAMLFCLAWPGAGIVVLGEQPVVVCNIAASRRFAIQTITPLQDAADHLGPELMELIEHGRSGGVGRSEFRVARQYLVAPLVLDADRAAGALVLGAGAPSIEQDHAHHVRNLLARLRSITAHSAETAQSIEDYAAHLDGRISAAGRAETSRMLGGELSADLESLLLDELTYQAVREGDNYKVEGPDVEVPAHAIDAIALALHELATNAVKFGAFSQRNGFLNITWRLDHRANGDWLVIHWQEQGVTLPAEPPREGFGMALIRHRLPYELQGETAFEFRPGGIQAMLSFPLHQAVTPH